MGILLGFGPFILFALLTEVSVSLALWAAFATAFAITIRDFVHSKMLRVLDIGSMGLFGALALYAGFVQPSLSVQALRLMTDAGFLLIAIVSIAVRNPLTLAYARERVVEEFWDAPSFVRANYVITCVWTLAFLVMAAADGVATFDQKFPFSLDVAAGLGALAPCIVFTLRYPGYVRSQMRTRR